MSRISTFSKFNSRQYFSLFLFTLHLRHQRKHQSVYSQAIFALCESNKLVL